jgi:hypothetical protein
MVVDVRNPLIGNCARQSIAVPAHLVRCRAKRTCVVPFTTDDDGHRGTVLGFPARRIELLKRFQDLR